MRRSTVLMCAVMAVFLVAVGCAGGNQGRRTVQAGQVQRAASVSYGTILAVEEVMLESGSTALGLGGGAVAGGVLGHAVMGRSGRNRRSIGALTGAAAGATAGSIAERRLTNADGIEIEVQLDNGEIYVVVQELDDVYKVGDLVRVFRFPDGTMRIRQ
jgi:outer membrane lipoprotein SlyB